MSVQALGHFVVRMTVDFDKLREYLENPRAIIPAVEGDETPVEIRRCFGDLTPDEVKLIRRGNFNQIFEYLSTAGPKPIGGDQLNYP